MLVISLLGQTTCCSALGARQEQLRCRLDAWPRILNSHPSCRQLNWGCNQKFQRQWHALQSMEILSKLQFHPHHRPCLVYLPHLFMTTSPYTSLWNLTLTMWTLCFPFVNQLSQSLHSSLQSSLKSGFDQNLDDPEIKVTIADYYEPLQNVFAAFRLRIHFFPFLTHFIVRKWWFDMEIWNAFLTGKIKIRTLGHPIGS